MAGIVCMFNMNGRDTDSELLNKLIANAKHRGEDYIHTWTDDHIGLGHRQFFTTAESMRERQPLSDISGNYWITCDGRVDNREDLISLLGLEKDGLPTDATLILNSYIEWGVDCLQRIVGDFAFVIWDKRKQQMFCARDYLGVRPFFYTQIGEKFIGSSTVKQILQHPDLKIKLNDAFIADYLLYATGGTIPVPDTIYKNVIRLPLAHYLIVDRNGVNSPTPYWDPRNIPEIVYPNEQDYIDQFRHLFRKAVGSRLRCSWPVASELSGGLDSSSIVAMAQKIYDDGEMDSRGFATCSMVFDEYPELDEREYQQAITETLDVSPYSIVADNEVLMKNLMEHAPFPDEPAGSHMAYDQSACTAKSAKEFGARVLLKGEGGDELLQGNPLYLADFLRKGKFIRFGREINAWSRSRNMSYLYATMSLGLKPLIPASLHRILETILRKQPGFWNDLDQFHGPVIPPWIDSRFAERMSVRERVRDLLPDKNFPRSAMRLEYRMLYEGNAYAWIDDNVTSERSIEIRLPFLDRRLVEFSMGIPMSLKCQIDSDGDRYRKVILRHAMKGLLPEKIRTRTSTGNFSRLTLRGFQEAIPKLISRFEALGGAELVKRGYLDPEVYMDQIRLWKQGHWIYSGNVLNTLALELWLHKAHLKYNI